MPSLSSRCANGLNLHFILNWVLKKNNVDPLFFMHLPSAPEKLMHTLTISVNIN